MADCEELVSVIVVEIIYANICSTIMVMIALSRRVSEKTAWTRNLSCTIRSRLI
jgi:hypothetical protein